jgi:tetratricopeptide (TPR) repeat protein
LKAVNVEGRMDHPGDRELKRWLSGRSGQKTRRRIVRHLLSRCETCPEKVRSLLPPDRLWSTSEPESGETYEACIDHALAAARPLAESWERERALKERGIALVRAKGWGNLTASERRALQGSWARVEILLDLSFEMRYRNRQVMLELALSAQRAAGRLQPAAACPESLLFDLRARVAAEVANAERVNERFWLAEEALAQAQALLDQGTGDLAVEAYIEEVEASLLKDFRRLAEAEELLGQAHRAYKKLGEHHLAGRALLSRGSCRFFAGKPREAVHLFRQALSLLDAGRDPHLLAAAQFNLLDALVESGELGEASRLLLESGLRQTFADDPLNLLRIRWVEGKILAGRDRFKEAERVFTEVRDGFREQGLEFVAAVAGLDLAKLLLRQGKTGPVHELAKELSARAKERKIHPEAVNALHGFEYVCRVKVVSVQNAELTQKFLNQLESWPSLRWEPELMFVG